MIATDDDALVCDMAETYRIYDYRALPPGRAAVLACGLHEDARINMKMRKQEVTLDTLLHAIIADQARLLVWSKTKDGEKNRNRPESIAEKLLQGPDKEDKVKAFVTADDFAKAFQRLAGGE